MWKPAPLAVPGGDHGRLAIELGIGALVGLLAGFMGVGGGILAVPAFTLVLGMPQRIAQGTSLAVILMTAPVGTFENARHGQVAWKLVPPLAIGAAIGGPIASWLAHRVPQETLGRLFALFLTASAIHAWLRSGRGRRPVTIAID